MNKTTSFSKILASKNNAPSINSTDSTPLASNPNSTNINQKQISMNILTSNGTKLGINSTSGGDSQQQQQQQPITDSFFIDSINENNFNQKTEDVGPNGIFDTKDPKFSDNEEAGNQHNTNNSNSRPNQTGYRMKNWKSESNLIASNQKVMNHSLNNPGVYELGEDEEEYDEYDNFDYYIDGMNGDDEAGLEDEVNINEPLQFSDHAALYDPYENDEQLGNGSDSMDESKYLNENKRRMLLDNYDTYTKKNYKLTYNRPHSSGTGQQQQEQPQHTIVQDYNTRVEGLKQRQQQLRNNTDSSSNLDNSNYMEEEDEDEDQEFDAPNREDNNAYLFMNQNTIQSLQQQQQSFHQNSRPNHNSNQSNAAMFKNDYYSYLNSLKNSRIPNGADADFMSASNNQQISDSIMNWSMKISNYNSYQNNNHYQPEYDSNNHNNRRSKSRSPQQANANMSQFSRSNSSFSKFYNQQNSLEDSVSNLSPPVQFRNKNNNNKSHKKSPSNPASTSTTANNLKPPNKSTTSWGKLKHSKSSSSNIGCSMDGSEAQNHMTNSSTYTPAHQTQDGIKHVKKTQSKPYQKQKHHTTNIDAYQNKNSERPQSLNNPMNRYQLNQQNIDDFEQLQQFIRRSDNYQLDDSSSHMIYQQQHQNNNNNMPLSSPSLIKLFQKQRSSNITSLIQNSDEFSSETTNSSSNNNKHPTAQPKQKVKQKKHESNQKRSRSRQPHNQTQDHQPIKTTSFSQLRQRSLSSCAISGAPTNTSENNIMSPNHSSTSSSINQSINSSTNTNSNTSHNSSIMKKSFPIQQAPLVTRAEDGSTIVCMVVDPHNPKSNEELMAVAARAARAYKRERTSKVYNTKASLPDLTFLKDYADEKPQLTQESIHRISNRPKTKETQSQMKNSASAAASIGHVKQANPSKQVQPQQQQQQHQQLIAPVGSDLLKRKTLKSIKRYRQTKQNTEPCLNNQQQQHRQELSIATQSQLQTSALQYSPNEYSDNRQNIELSSTSSSSGSGATNTSGYASQHVTLINNNNNNTSRQATTKELKLPLKSCLKRKDSASSSQSQASSSGKNSATSPMLHTRRSKSTNQQSMIQQQTAQQKLAPATIIDTKYTLMFVPFVGFLFTHDKGSVSRYAYYNKLDRNRRFRNYRALTSGTSFVEEYDDDEEDEDETDDEAATEKNRMEFHESGAISRSDNDLRVKKSVTFLAHVIEHRHHLRNQSSGSSAASSAMTTPTVASPHHNKASLSKQPSTEDSQLPAQQQLKPEAPLLQYNALIAMLKSNSVQNKKRQEAEKMGEYHQINSRFEDLSHKNSQRSSHRQKATESHVRQSQKQQEMMMVKKQPKMMKPSDEFQTYFNMKSKSQVIDADSISLGSLSESPPSEFKFSDEDGNDSDAENIAALKAANNFNVASVQKGIRKDADFPAISQKSGNNKLKYQQQPAKPAEVPAPPVPTQVSPSQIKELNKNIQQQQMKLNQLEQLRNRKKNFHSILLKDSKLNNLKEVLFEIKQTQQKLSMLAQQKRDMQTAPLKVTNYIVSELEIKSVDMAEASVLGDMRNTVEQLSQHLFEFLKQGLKTGDTSQSMTTSNLTQTPPTSPITNSITTPQALSDSSSLTLIYSQYTQLWNLIETTITLNINNSPKHKSSHQQSLFHLPKEAYVNMFQEINNYASSTNQTYLIDSGINTSQLRKKHHFMVMLKSMKFKFQLFVVNLLNHKQMANWFDFLNKDKSVLRKHYDLKLPSSNSANSGDSGVGEFLSTSDSTSSLASSLSHSQNHAQLVNSSQILASLSITSLANVSIFENEEYFSYYHKLLQQFNFIELNLTSFNVNHEKYELSCLGMPPSPPTPKQKPAIPTRKPNNSQQQQRHGSNNLPQQNATTPTSAPMPLNTSANNTNNNGVFKSISKKFNIKSWFSHSNNNNGSGNGNSSDLKTSQSSQVPLSNKFGQTTPPPSMSKLSLYETTPTTKCCQNISQPKTIGRGHNSKSKNHSKNSQAAPVLSLMKHSLSEPSLNALIK